MVFCLGESLQLHYKVSVEALTLAAISLLSTCYVGLPEDRGCLHEARLGDIFMSREAAFWQNWAQTCRCAEDAQTAQEQSPWSRGIPSSLLSSKLCLLKLTAGSRPEDMP